MSSVQLTEDEIFNILSHQIRREILKKLYSETSLTFSTISRELGISTGSIYHHLDILQLLVSQNTRKEYKLTETGKHITENYLGSEKDEVRVIQFNQYVASTRDVFTKIQNNWIYSFPIIFSIFGFVLYLTYREQVILAGPIFYPFPNMLPGRILLFNIGFFFFHIAILYLFFIYFKKPENNTIIAVFTLFFLSLVITQFLISGIIIINTFLDIFTLPIIWIVSNLISQVIFLLICSIGQVYYLKIDVKISIIIILSVLYFDLIMIILLT